MENKLVRNGRWCVPTPLVHRLVAEYHDALHLTTTSMEKHLKEINHGVEGVKVVQSSGTAMSNMSLMCQSHA